MSSHTYEFKQGDDQSKFWKYFTLCSHIRADVEFWLCCSSLNERDYTKIHPHSVDALAFEFPLVDKWLKQELKKDQKIQ